MYLTRYQRQPLWPVLLVGFMEDRGFKGTPVAADIHRENGDTMCLVSWQRTARETDARGNGCRSFGEWRAWGE